MQFDDQDPAGRRFIGWDFAPDLRNTPNVSITGATFSASLVSGTDADPSSLLSGGEVIDGLKVSKLRSGGVSGARYRVRIEAMLSDGQVLIETALINIQSQ